MKVVGVFLTIPHSYSDWNTAYQAQFPTGNRNVGLALGPTSAQFTDHRKCDLEYYFHMPHVSRQYWLP